MRRGRRLVPLPAAAASGEVSAGGLHGLDGPCLAAALPPGQLFWAYFTGAGQLAAGLSPVSGVASRLAATLLAAMYATFVLILHVPRVIADPASRLEWTMLVIALSLNGAAWIVRTAAKGP